MRNRRSRTIVSHQVSHETCYSVCSGIPSVQIRIRHLLWLTIAVAVLFALATWGDFGWTVLWTMLFLVHLCFLGLPMAIFVFAIGTSPVVNKQLDVKKNKLVAVCLAAWLGCAAVVFVFWSIVTRIG